MQSKDRQNLSRLRQAGLVLCALIFLTGDIYAAPCYGTRLPKKKQFSVGLESYSIFKRYLENEYGKVRSLQQFVLISAGIFDWLAIDLKGGAGNIKQRPSGSLEIDYPYGFSGGYGFRLKFYDAKNIKSVFGFQHISIHPGSRHVDGVKNKAILDDWQVSLLVSRSIGRLEPYAGARWSRLDYIHRVGSERKRKMSDLTKSAGFILGLNLGLSERSWLNLEGQFLDSQALAVSLNHSF